ncbi:MAG: hypothetical protein FWF19_03590 [Euryarchaeota archaeon]|nr:hypothetical protein [Euryarchaeota archaeon]
MVLTSESKLIPNATEVTLVSDDPLLKELIAEWNPSTCDNIETDRGSTRCSFHARDLVVEIYEIEMSIV